MGLKAPGQADRLQHQVGAGNATWLPRYASLHEKHLHMSGGKRPPLGFPGFPCPRPAAGAWLGAAMELT